MGQWQSRSFRLLTSSADSSYTCCQFEILIISIYKIVIAKLSDTVAEANLVRLTPFSEAMLRL